MYMMRLNSTRGMVGSDARDIANEIGGKRKKSQKRKENNPIGRLWFKIKGENKERGKRSTGQ
jgi:hypothetical protein